MMFFNPTKYSMFWSTTSSFIAKPKVTPKSVVNVIRSEDAESQFARFDIGFL